MIRTMSFLTVFMTQLAATQNGFSGAFTGSDQFCNYTGFFGGVRDVPQ